MTWPPPSAPPFKPGWLREEMEWLSRDQIVMSWWRGLSLARREEIMARALSEPEHAMRSAIGNLWEVQSLAEEAIRFEGQKAGLAVWCRNADNCKRWVAVVAAGGRGRDLPPHLRDSRAYFNGLGWRIPE